jgi:AcrR family transcriptional regulator
MTVTSPYRQQKHDAMVRSILDTAREIMREQGVAALSMQELARRLNLRAPSLYYYFASKMDIYDALFRLGFSLYREAVNQTHQENEALSEYILRSFECYFSFAQQNPDLYQLCFERPVPGFTPSAESLQISFSMLSQAYQLVEGWQGAIQTGLTSQQIANLVIAMMHGLTAMHMSNEPSLPIGQGRFGSLIPAAQELFTKAWALTG